MNTYDEYKEMLTDEKTYEENILPFYLETKFKPKSYELLKKVRPYLSVVEHILFSRMIRDATTGIQLLTINRVLFIFRERDFIR